MTLPARPEGTPRPSAGRLPPVLLAERQGVVFVATSSSVDSLRVPRRYRGAETSVVALPAQEEEIGSCELTPDSDGDDWPRALPRPDLLAPALSRMLSSEHVELSLQPGRDGGKAMLIAADGRRHPFPIAPKDSLGLLAALFHNAPRGVVTLGPARPGRILVAVRPAPRPREYRLRVAGAVGSPAPRSLKEIGLSPALFEVLGEALDRPSGLLLIAAGSSSGRSTTLDLMAEALVARGRSGGRVGPKPRVVDHHLPWLADSVTEWPFPESLKEAASDFVVVERLEGLRQMLLAAQLAASGTLVLAGAAPAGPQALLRRVAREIEAASGPSVPVMVLAQALIRTVCPACKTWKTIPAAQGIRLGFHRSELLEMERRGGFRVPSGEGCPACVESGYGGLTGVFGYADADGVSGSLPSLLEEGWRKVAEGSAGHEDVKALPAPQHALRSLREIAVLAGLTPAPPPDPADRGAPTVPGDRRPSQATEEAPQESPPSADADVAAMMELFRAAQAGQAASPERLQDLARGIAGRAADADPAGLIVGPPGRYRLARHAVNTALLSVRIVAALGQGEDGPATAMLALLHDAGLLGGGLDPGADLPAIELEAAIDPEGRRLRPEATLAALGAGDAGLVARVVDVQELLGTRAGLAERSRADLRCQAVALASLIDLTYNASAASSDLHEVSSVVMARHGQRFSPLLFRALLRAIPIFPVGCLVELSSGDVARVVAQNDDNHFRPRVEIRAGGSGSARRVVDLARAPFLHIRQRVPRGTPEARP